MEAAVPDDGRKGVCKYLKNQVCLIPDFSGIFEQMKPTLSSFLLVDDHPLLIRGLTEVLKKHFQDALFYAAQNGNEALQLLSQSPVDIVLLDVAMPEMDGYTVFPQIKKKYPTTKIILLTQYGGRALNLHFLQQGVDGIFFKGENEDIESAINTVWAGGRWFPPTVEALMPSLMGEKKETGKLPLSDRDRMLLRYIGLGKSSKEISSLMNLGENTINSYRQLLLRQTGTRNTDELIAYTQKNGLIL